MMRLVPPNRFGRFFFQHPAASAAEPAAADGSPQEPSRLRVDADDIALDVVVASRSELLAEVAQHMESVHGLAREEVERALAHRERIASTALGQGVALPHARIAGLAHMRAMYVRLRLPIPYEAPDGQPVRDVLVLLVPKRAAQQHLDVLAQATQLFAERAFRDEIHRCRDPRSAGALIEHWLDRLPTPATTPPPRLFSARARA